MSGFKRNFHWRWNFHWQVFLWIMLLCTPLISKPYWVFFRDKGGEKNASIYYAALPQRTKTRRAKMGVRAGKLWDIPVYQGYLNRITHSGGRLRITSKWLNAASFELDKSDSATIANLPFVIGIKPVGSSTCPLPEPESFYPTIEDSLYGQSWDYLERMGIVKMHKAGYHGEGVRIAFLDTGCRLSHQAFDSTNIVATWDVINNDPVISNEEGDTYNQDSHGTYTSSVVAGYLPGQLIGVAYKAEFLLIKTERVDTEIVMEEDFWVRGIEWAESLGTDIVSSSLAYSDWYSREDMNGHTAITTRAANRAAELGVLVVNAAGNDRGTDWNYISAPADADSIITVGALDRFERVASFSSPGPTYDGRRKPDLATLGVSVPRANPNIADGIVRINGTSLSTPLVTGTAALLLQAFPELTPMELKDSLCQWADQYFAADTDVGYGMPNPFLSATKPTTLYLELIDGATLLPLDTTFTLERSSIDTVINGETNGRGIAVIYPLQPGSYTLSFEYIPGRFFRKNFALSEGKQHRRIVIGRSESQSIVIYPNPFSDSLTVSLPTEPQNEAYAMLFTLSGNLIKRKKFEKFTTLELPKLADGVYILVISVDGKKEIRKVACVSR